MPASPGSRTRYVQRTIIPKALMHWCSRLFGNSELLVEYFAVARGYGLALAFEMLSLCLFLRAYEQTEQRHLVRDLYLAVAAGSLSVLSNFAWVNYYLPLLLAGAWLLLTEGSLRRISRRHIGATLALVAGSGLFLSYILAKLLKLQRDRQLFFGGHDSFVSDTIHSLVQCSLYSALNSPAVVRLISGILPIERAALYYVPLYAAILVYALGLLRGVPSESWRSILAPILATATAVAVGWSFCRGFTERTSCVWLVDKRNHNREVLELIERDRAERSPTRKVKLRASWRMVPSLDFYRKTRKYTWLTRVIPGPIPDPDYIYAFEGKLGTADGIRLASYPDLHTVLVRVNPAGRR